MMMTTHNMRLNLGCQIHYFDGWVNVDIVGDDPNIKVDLNCNADTLHSIEDNSVDFIYAGHLVEHFYPDTLLRAVMEWKRVLKPNDKLVIVTPDCGTVFNDYQKGRISMQDTWQQIYGRIYAYDRDSERHHIAFDYSTLMRLTQAYDYDYEWKSSEPLDFFNPPKELEPFMDKHISRGAYQLGIILTK